jgi:hypothetical protein
MLFKSMEQRLKIVEDQLSEMTEVITKMPSAINPNHHANLVTSATPVSKVPIQEFAVDQKAAKIEGLGENGYEWGTGGSNVVFTLHNLTIGISTDSRDPLDVRKLTHEFAQIIADALREAT